MNFRTITLVLVLLLLAVFTAANWAVVSAPADLNLLAGRVQAPFGLVMIGVVVVMGAAYSLLLMAGERRLLRDNAAQARELAELRAGVLEQQLDEVRDLRTALESGLGQVRGTTDALTRVVQGLVTDHAVARRDERSPTGE